MSRHRSPQPGYAGMVEEMRWGLANLLADEREEADRRVLTAIFFGRGGLGALRMMRSAAATATSRLLAAGAPVALRWLVGEIEHVAPGVNQIAECAFRKAGGDDLCQRVCREPTQAFCSAHAVRVRLDPDPESPACTWRWG